MQALFGLKDGSPRHSKLLLKSAYEVDSKTATLHICMVVDTNKLTQSTPMMVGTNKLQQKYTYDGGYK